MAPAAATTSSHAAVQLDDLVASIQKLTSIQEITKDLIPQLKKVDKSNAKVSVFEGVLKDDKDPLVVLDPAQFTVGYLFILNARLNASTADLALLSPFITQFAEKSSPEQLKLVPEQVTYLSKTIVLFSDSSKTPSFAVAPLKHLVQKFAPPGTLTALHPIFLQAVIASRDYAPAAEVLQTTITDVNTSAYPIKYIDHLLYHYLGGTIAALLRNHVLAAEMLEICVSAPGQAVSAVQIDAYKKLVLIQLLVDGKHVALPTYTSSTVSSACKTSCANYIEVATAYVSNDKLKLRTTIERLRETFERDLNLGLVHLAERAFRRRAIQRLTETYITLSLVDIAQAVDLPLDESGFIEAENEVLSMLAAGEVHGSLSHPRGADWKEVTVTFMDDPEPYNSHETVERVTKAIAKAQALDKALKDKGANVEKSKDFVQKAYNAAGQVAGLGGLGGDEDIRMGSGFDWDGEDA
ncbi:hypothetical protein T439DRAFT_321611 [Meredithblackwellia eburnea MCA 4105]